MTLTKETKLIIGRRVKMARLLSGFSRQQFEVETGISAATLRYWEEPPAGRSGLSIKSANRLVEAFKKLNINCSENWLMTGKGIAPRIESLDHFLKNDNLATGAWGEEEAILKEINAFRENNPNAIVTTIMDNAMLPYFKPGDYVGGIMHFGDEIQYLQGLDCILKVNNAIMVRRLSVYEKKQRCILTALNHDQKLAEPVIKNIKVKAAAEIVWHRKRSRIDLQS